VKYSTLWKMVETGRLPEYYRVQVQHQLIVTKANVAEVFVFDGTEGIRLEVAPEPATWPRIHAAWDEFMAFVAKNEAPPLTDRDVRVREDSEWLSAAAAYLELRTAHDELGAALDAAKSRLVGQTSHVREQGGGLSVTRLWKRGSVDYRCVPELVGVDLEVYRSAAREEVRVTVS